MDNTGSTNPADKLVLIVDDDPSIRELLKILVNKDGFRTEMAEDGKEGLEKARALKPDMILLDLMLPKSGGYEIVRELQNEATEEIPIIVISARVMDPSTRDMIRNERNVKDFAEKPIKHQLLLARMHQLLKTRPLPRKA